MINLDGVWFLTLNSGMHRRTRDFNPHYNTPHHPPLPSNSGISAAAALMWVMRPQLTFEIPLLHNGIWWHWITLVCSARAGGMGGLVLALTSQMRVGVRWLDTAFDLPMNYLNLTVRWFNIYLLQKLSSLSLLLQPRSMQIKIPTRNTGALRLIVCWLSAPIFKY